MSASATQILNDERERTQNHWAGAQISAHFCAHMELYLPICSEQNPSKSQELIFWYQKLFFRIRQILHCPLAKSYCIKVNWKPSWILKWVQNWAWVRAKLFRLTASAAKIFEGTKARGLVNDNIFTVACFDSRVHKHETETYGFEIYLIYFKTLTLLACSWP